MGVKVCTMTVRGERQQVCSQGQDLGDVSLNFKPRQGLSIYVI